jgi:signal transduction histidine kinase
MMTPPGYGDLDQRSLVELAAKGSCTPFEKEYIRRDGARVPSLLGAATFEDNPDEGVCFVLDITERKQTETARRESEERFRFLNDLSQAIRALADPKQIMAVTARMLAEHLNASHCAYADVEEDGELFTILHDYTNGCASMVGRYKLSLFGTRAVATLQRAETLIIRNVEAELLPDEGADAFNAIGLKATIACPLVKEGGLRAMMAVHQTTARDWKSAEITIVQDVDERCWATIERRTAEENIQRVNTELEQRVVERTTQLEAANQELEAFSFSVSHDLRAPLRTMDGFSLAVMEDYGQQLPEEGRRFLQSIRDGAEHMSALINDLLAFARLSRQSLNKRAVDTQRLVRLVIEDLASQLEGRQIEIRMSDLPPCQGDPALLKQVWVNLLSNALKNTRKLNRTIVEIGCVRENNENVYFVRDNGTGFDMKYAHKLFGVFQRLHRAEDYEGTGVGLALVQRVIHRHGGRIWAEALLEHGATFYFTLEEGAK